MKHRPCRLHESCTRPDGHDGACGDPVGDLKRPPSITRPASDWDKPGPFCTLCGTENLPGAHRCQVCGSVCARPS